MNTLVWRPTIFDLSNRADRHALQLLGNAHPKIDTHDALAAQILELVKIRNPSMRLSADDWQPLVDAHLGGRPIEEYGVHVHYPWSNRLVRLLPEKEFVEVRTARNQHKITTAEQSLLMDKKVGVIGLSVGQSVALTIAMERSAGEIRLADFDTLDLSNLNRIRSGVHNLGIPKAAVTAREIAEIDPFLRVRCFFEGVTEDNLDRFLLEDHKLDLLVEESDGVDIKFLARYRARELGIPVVMDTSDRGLLDIERFDLEPHRAIFHGLTGDVDPEQLRNLTAEEKISHILKVACPETVSARMKASLIEIGQSISTWPQLASSVVLGGAVTADASRRILLDQLHISGRFFIDLEKMICDPAPRARSEIVPVDTGRNALSSNDASIHEYLARFGNPLAADATRTDVLHVVEAAVRAPSGGNCQPWRWVWQNDALFLFHDRHRSGSFLDFEHSASFVALGAAAENVQLAAHRLGLVARRNDFPLGTQDSLVAVFTFERAGISVDAPHPLPQLADCIERRQTNRRLGERRAISHPALQAIRSAAESVAGASFRMVTSSDALDEAALMLGAVERLQLLHETSHRELTSEIRWTHEDALRTGDGIDLETLDLSAADRVGLSVAKDWEAMSLLAAWNRGTGLGVNARRAAESAGAICLIAMPERSPRSFLEGGSAAQRAWLMATQYDVAFQPIAPVSYLLARARAHDRSGMSGVMRQGLAQVEASYERLFGDIGDRADILLFRLAVADAPRIRSARRDLRAVLECRERNQRFDVGYPSAAVADQPHEQALSRSRA